MPPASSVAPSAAGSVGSTMLGLIIVIALLIPLLAVILDSPPARAMAARLERDDSLPVARMDQRVRELEGEVERLGRELERLGEEHSFLERLLSEKVEARAALEPGQPEDRPEGPLEGAPRPPGDVRE